MNQNSLSFDPGISNIHEVAYVLDNFDESSLRIKINNPDTHDFFIFDKISKNGELLGSISIPSKSLISTNANFFKSLHKLLNDSSHNDFVEMLARHNGQIKIRIELLERHARKQYNRIKISCFKKLPTDEGFEKEGELSFSIFYKKEHVLEEAIQLMIS